MIIIVALFVFQIRKQLLLAVLNGPKSFLNNLSFVW